MANEFGQLIEELLVAGDEVLALVLGFHKGRDLGRQHGNSSFMVLPLCGYG